MAEFGNVLFLVAFAYGLGQLWYSVLDHRHDGWMRIASFPFLGMIAGEAFMPMGPEVFGVHVVVAFVATFVACLVDKLVHAIRPGHEAELRPAHA